MKTLLLVASLMSIGMIVQAQITVSSGTVKRFENLPSKNVDPRNVDVWLPEGYTQNEKYAVLYMHDGQMLFDSTTTWNKQEWLVDEVLTELMKTKKIRKTIVVGIWNNGALRHAEYFPQKALQFIPDAERQELLKMVSSGPKADAYLRFLVTELKPFIDSAFSTKKDAANTFIAGSSMGGLISMYAICEYPKIFGGAACISTHWIGTFKDNDYIPKAFQQYLEQNLPSPKNHKIYFDYGTATLDQYYKPHQLKVNEIMAQKGFTKRNWITREFVGEDHSERAWSGRLAIPITFLMSK